MSVFEYIIGIHTIVLGLATAKLLSTLADTFKYRKTIGPFWVHTLWCVVTQLTIIGWWWLMWRMLNETSSYTYLSFLWIFSYSIATFIISSFLAIDIAEQQDIDLEKYYFQIKNPMFVTWGIGYGLLISWFVVAGDGSSSTGTGYALLNLVSLVQIPLVVAAGLFFSSRRAHEIIVVLFFITYIMIEVNQGGVGT